MHTIAIGHDRNRGEAKPVIRQRYSAVEKWRAMHGNKTTAVWQQFAAMALVVNQRDIFTSQEILSSPWYCVG
jgi:hypothetical protein